MMIKLEKGRICGSCNGFTKKIVACDACGRKKCLRCSADEHLCNECYVFRNGEREIRTYFEEKRENLSA